MSPKREKKKRVEGKKGKFSDNDAEREKTWAGRQLQRDISQCIVPASELFKATLTSLLGTQLTHLRHRLLKTINNATFYFVTTRY
jgi:hypothetical protein